MMMRRDRCGKNWPSITLHTHPCAADLDQSIVPPEPRAGSLPYEPTREQVMQSPILAACWQSGMTESQVIEMLWRCLRRQQVQIQRLLMTQPPMRFTIPTEPKR